MEHVLHRVLENLRKQVLEEIQQLYIRPASNHEEYVGRIGQINMLESTIVMVKDEIRKARTAEGFDGDDSDE